MSMSEKFYGDTGIVKQPVIISAHAHKDPFPQTVTNIFNTVALRKYLSFISSGLPSDRTNLSPFTKDFRGGGQLNEHLTNFLSALPNSGATSSNKSELTNILDTLKKLHDDNVN